MSVVHEESFGPVLTVETFTDEDDAVRIGNDTTYGLAGAVWNEDRGKAQRVAEPARARHDLDQRRPPLCAAGRVGRVEAVRQRPRAGPAGLSEYREIKHIWQNINPSPQGWFSGVPRRKASPR